MVIRLPREMRLKVGSLGKIRFPAGTYIYTGSAMNGLKARLLRHLKTSKPSRWHIDYLLQCPEAQIKRILIYPPAPDQECRQNQRVAALPRAQVISRGFGASDCRQGCPAHLVYFPQENLPHRLGRLLRPANRHKED